MCNTYGRVSFVNMLASSSWGAVCIDTKIAGNLQNLSDNQKVYGKPAVLNFLSKEDDRFDQFSLQMKLDRTKAEAQDSINGEVRALKLEKMEAGDGMMIDKGFANLSGVFRIVGENQVAGTMQANLSQLALSISEKEGDVIFNSVVIGEHQNWS